MVLCVIWHRVYGIWFIVYGIFLEVQGSFDLKGSMRARVETPYKGMIYTLRLQIAQSRSYLYTLGPKVGIMYILGALRIGVIHGATRLHAGTLDRSSCSCMAGGGSFFSRSLQQEPWYLGDYRASHFFELP